jgi:omega-6 fatty acid desaturase (delta-12 desaturase)
MATNAAIASLAGASIWLVGTGPFLAVHLPVVLLAASIGVWLFYIQHQFEFVMWFRDGNWKLTEAALLGSSYYDLPGVLRWFTANVGVHHVHHLNSRIPSYRLQQVLRDHPGLQDVGRISICQSLRSSCLSLWDETQQRLIAFSEVEEPGWPNEG